MTVNRTKAKLVLRANAREVRTETLYGGQFKFSTQLIILNYPIHLCDYIFQQSCVLPTKSPHNDM